MKAVVKTGPGEGQLELKDWPEPSPAPDEVKIKIAAASKAGGAATLQLYWVTSSAEQLWNWDRVSEALDLGIEW